jgi:hypothetical protein
MTAVRESFVRELGKVLDGASENGAASEEVRGVRPLRMWLDQEIEIRPKPAEIVEGFLFEKSTAALVGEPGSGKGLLTIDLLYRVAHGMDWHGHATKQGTCVYIAMERQGGLGARIRAWKAHHNRPEPAAVVFTLEKFSLYQPLGAKRLLDALAELPQPIRIVAVDTLAKAILPGNENETLDMGTFVGNLQLVAETGPTVLIVHHKNAAGTRERGNTSLRGDVDTMLVLESPNGGKELKLVCDKQNEGEEPKALSLSIVQVAESAVVVTAAAVNGHMLSRSQLEILKSLRVAGLGQSASASTWLKAYGGKERTFYDARSALVRKGYVSATTDKRPRYSLTLAGESAVTADCGDTADSLRAQPDTHLLRHCGGGYKDPRARSAVQQ